MDRIPANARSYIKQVRANRQKQKQKQSQSTTVIINPESKRRRGPNKPKSAPASGGGAPSIIPYIIPQTQLTAASYQNSAVQPPDAIQQLTQALNQFQATPVYRNPFRMEPFRTAMNPTPLRNEEAPLPEPAQAPPPPVMPDIVEEQNFVEQLARPPVAVPILPSMPTYQGFAENRAVNQLNRQVELEVNAFNDFGGLDAQSPTEETYQAELGRQREKLNVFMGGGGGMGPYDEIPSPSTPATQLPISNKGRPFAPLTQDERFAIEIYLLAKHDKALKRGFDAEQKGLYSRGSKLVTQNKKNNPEVIALKEEVKARIARDESESK